MSDAKCQSCGEPLLWVENVESGKRLPLLRKPINNLSREQVKPGMVAVSPNRQKGKIITLSDIGGWSEGLATAVAENRVHQTHFADCPQRDEWSGSSRAQQQLA